MVGRGDHSEIDVVPGRQLDSKYSGNTVDICPVGALLNRDFRFTSRVWYLENTRTVCDGCANGCNVGADARGDVVYRYLPKRNEEVNQVWLCDDGRTSYHRTTDARLQGPKAGRGDDAAYPFVEQSVELARDALKPLVGSGALAVGISAALSTEEAYAAAVFARDVLKTKKIFATGRAAGTGDDFLIRGDKNPNTNGLRLAASAAKVELGEFGALEKLLGGQVKQLVLFGAELPASSARLPDLETLVVFGANDDAVTQAATLALPLATHLEFDGTFVNYYGRLQRFARVVAPGRGAQPAWAWVSQLTQALGGELEVRTGAEAFGLLAATGAPFAGLTLEGLPATGLTLPGMLPAEFAKKAPKPATT
jgi:NADH-quinone oxidoreductase subunit G